MEWEDLSNYESDARHLIDECRYADQTEDPPEWAVAILCALAAIYDELKEDEDE